MKQISINLLPGKDERRIKRKKMEFVFFGFGIVLSFIASIFLDNFIAYQVKKCEVHKTQLIEKIRTVSTMLKKLKQPFDQFETLF